MLLQIENLRVLLQPVLQAHPTISLVLFGSRARGAAHAYADIDLGVVSGDAPLSFAEFSRIKDAIDDLTEDWPVMVECVNLSAAPAWFRDSIAPDVQCIAGNTLAWQQWRTQSYEQSASR